MWALSHSNTKNQLYYLLVTSSAVGYSSGVDKAATLTRFTLGWIIGSQLEPTLRTEPSIRIGCSTAVGALIDPKFGPTALAKTCLSIV
jgi:hypothetical protein